MHGFSHDFGWFLSTIPARTLIVVLFLIVGLRLLGKREIGQMNIYDLALIMLLANAVQNAMTNGAGDLSVGLASAATLLLFGRAVTAVFRRMPKLQERIVGTPTVLIHDGQWLPDHMRKERITTEEVLAVLRQHGLTDPSQALLAILEVDGTISIIPRSESNRMRKSRMGKDNFGPRDTDQDAPNAPADDSQDDDPDDADAPPPDSGSSRKRK